MINKNKNKGFTAREIIVVIALVAVLVSVLSPEIMAAGVRTKAKNAVTEYCEENNVTLIDDGCYELDRFADSFDCTVRDADGNDYVVRFEYVVDDGDSKYVLATDFGPKSIEAVK